MKTQNTKIVIFENCYKVVFSKPTKFDAFDDVINNVATVYDACCELSKHYEEEDLKNVISITLINP